MNKTYLFAYGTLRKEFGLEVLTEVKEHLIFIGTGKIAALLYDLGTYPGAVKTADRKVAGDVFEILNPENVLLHLDDYEGEEYKRSLETIKMDLGEDVKAWVYWLNGEVANHNEINGSDYLNYLKTKDSLR